MIYLKMFEQFSEYNRDLFIERIKKEFIDDDYSVELVDDNILEINDSFGNTFIDFYVDKKHTLDDILDEMMDFKKRTNDELLDETLDDDFVVNLLSKLFDFVDKYYREEYQKYLINKKVRKFKI